MKITDSIGRSLHVLVLALCGLSFYALMLMLLFLLIGLIASTGAHSEILSVGPGSKSTGSPCATLVHARDPLASPTATAERNRKPHNRLP